MNVQAAKELLDAFQQVPRRPERPPTFMKVAGYSHYENVCSNVLAFFLDPEKPHGLGTLFLDALSRVGNIEDDKGPINSNISVGREVTTNEGNRIDILIKSDSHVILIENKIFSGIGNPFADYAKYVEGLEPPHTHKFLLTLKPVSNSTAHDCGFRNITHGDLANKIRDRLGHYVAGADTRYLTFMLDFLNTLENLQGGMAMNQEFVKFLASRSHDVKDFFKEIEGFQAALREKVKALESQLNDVKSYPNVKQWLYREPKNFFDVLVHDIRHPLFEDADAVVVDTILRPSGWEIQFFTRKNYDSDMPARLQRLLESLSIPFEKTEDNRRIVHETHFDYSADLGDIADLVRKVVRSLAHSNGAS